MNLLNYLNKELSEKSEENLELISLICSIADATVDIAMDTRVTGLKQIRGSANEVNIQGEEVQVLDQIANKKLIDSLKKNKSCAGYASEEINEPIMFNETSRFMVVADPLDGSSNISVNMPIGTIFGIIRNTDYGVTSFNKSGRYFISAGYSLYGPSDIFLICINNKVSEFTLDPDKKEYLISRDEIRVPKNGSIYSINEGNFTSWESNIKKWVLNNKNPTGTSSKNRSLRYVGSLVADAHRTLIKGGIFAYPPDKSRQEGKLRLMYEANPLALIFTSAGGNAVSMEKEILDIEPENFHQRTPLVLGSKEDIDEFLNYTTSGRSSFKETPEVSPIFRWNKINILKLRNKLGLNRSRFGKKVGVTRGTVLRWESGEVSPNLSNNKALDSIYLSTRNDLLSNPLDE
tara:strand:+ start:45 stop:1256 length:1212 start_codon:yes stop_codon:yes gene_type:complete